MIPLDAWHSNLIRNVFPFLRSDYIVSLLPFYILSGSFFLPERLNSASSILQAVLWFLIGLVLAEVFSVCFHRNSFIAAFQPHLIPKSFRPFGKSPKRTEDRRLQLVVKMLFIYGWPLVLIATVTDIHSNPISIVLLILFVTKYVRGGQDDFEGCLHWNIHCYVLEMDTKSRISRIIERSMDYGLGPLFGYVPNIYRANHLLLHHPEDAGPDDINSPLAYRRSSLLEFAVFVVRIFGSWSLATDLAFHRRCKRSNRRRVIAGVFTFWLVTVVLVAKGQFLGFWLLFLSIHVPVVVARAQYTWHSLSDVSQPHNTMMNTILWVRGDNWKRRLQSDSARSNGALATSQSSETQEIAPVFGSDWGYYVNLHLVHHMHPRAHFIEYPSLLDRDIPKIIDRGAVVMDLKYFTVFAIDTWSGRTDRLADALLNDIPQNQREDFITRRWEPLEDGRSSFGSLCSSSRAQVLNALLTKALAPIVKFQ